MNKAELEKQAKEYGLTVEQVKKYRKHIKPFLRFAIDCLKRDKDNFSGLCGYAHQYSIGLGNKYKSIYSYLKKRIEFARPKGSGDSILWWNRSSDLQGNKKRTSFCKLQLKIVIE